MKNNLGKRMKQLNRRNIQIRCVNSVVKKSPTRWDELLTYATSNVISVLSAVGSFLGGIIILLYLMEENYFPSDINLSSIGLLFPAAALVGIIFTALFAMYFVLPGYIYRNVLADLLKKDPIQLLENHVIFLLLDLPAVVVTVFLVIWAISGATVISWLGKAACTIVLLALTAIITITLMKKMKGKWNNFKDAFNSLTRFLIDFFPRVIRSLFIHSLFVFIISSLMACIPWVLLSIFAKEFSQDGATEQEFLVAVGILVVLIILANHLIALPKKWWLLFIVAPVLLILILAFTHQFAFIPRIVVHALSLGDIRNATLQLDEQGCQIAMQYSSASLEFKKSKPTLCTLAPVRIVWRIGNEYWISLNEVINSQDTATQAKAATPTSLSFAVEDKVQCPKIATENLSSCKGEAVDVNKLKSESLLFESNSKFSLPASHVLSWAVKPSQAGQSQK